MENQHSWLSPRGEFHPVSGSHSDWASGRGGIGTMFRSGWMRVNWVGSDLYLHNDLVAPNPRQRRAALDMALESERFRRVMWDSGEGEREISEGFREWLLNQDAEGTGL